MKIISPRARGFAVLVSVCLFILCGCSDPTSNTTTVTAHLRIVNGLMRAGTGGTATPVAIDYLIDSSTATPGIANLPALGITTTESDNGYRAISPGVRTFVARIAGDTSILANVYTTAGNIPYIPRQRLVAPIYYTMVVAGVLPATGLVPSNSIRFFLSADDPYPGYRVGGAYQARFAVINAAPYTNAAGTGASAFVYVTPGSTPPAGAINTYALQASANFGAQSGYVDVPPGQVVVTIAVGTAIVYQQALTFQAGEVSSLVLQSTAAGAPSIANHRVTRILNQLYTP